MSGNNKKSALKTPLAFHPILFTAMVDDEPLISEEDDVTMRKILKQYSELNKLYDQCIARIKTRNSK